MPSHTQPCAVTYVLSFDEMVTMALHGENVKKSVSSKQEDIEMSVIKQNNNNKRKKKKPAAPSEKSVNGLSLSFHCVRTLLVGEH